MLITNKLITNVSPAMIVTALRFRFTFTEIRVETVENLITILVLAIALILVQILGFRTPVVTIIEIIIKRLQ